MKRNGFTLAEMLITIAVIGFIAVLTIPILTRVKQDRDIVARVEVARSVLAQATQMAESQSGSLEQWDLTNMDEKEIFDTYYKPTLRVITNCFASGSDCWVETRNFKNDSPAEDGAKYGITGNKKNSLVLQDGLNVTMTKVASVDDKLGVYSSLPTSLVFMVDVNGQNSPNKMGQDVFAFVLTENGLLPAGTDNDSGNCQKSSELGDDFWDCSARVLNEGKRNYM